MAVCCAGAAADDLPSTRAFQPVDRGQQHRRIGDEKPVRPTDHRGHGALLGVACPVREPFGAALAPGRLRRGEVAVDAGTAGVVHRPVRVDRLVADPATPAVTGAHVIESTHRSTLLANFTPVRWRGDWWYRRARLSVPSARLPP